MESLLKFPRTVLDAGTGTGVLAIAAALLGATRVDAIETDPEAVEIARCNVELNRVENRVRVFNRDASRPSRRRYDLILANLTAETLIECAPAFARACRPGGYLIASGILRGPRATAVAEALRRSGFQILIPIAEAEWVSILAAAPGPRTHRS